MIWIKSQRSFIGILFLVLLTLPGCFHYGFSSGGTLPSDVHSIYIPFFPDQTNSGLSNLSDALNKSLVNRFVNQSKLQLANSQDNADILLDGSIQSYQNGPFSISGNQKVSLNRVTINVNASFTYTKQNKKLWSRDFSGFGDYDPNKDPIQGERQAALTAMNQIADKMFNESVGKW